MGKVLNHFKNGWPGAVSRSNDNVIISLRNASNGNIAFGTPVFFAPGENACKPFDQSTSTSANFIGFAVRIADKTPDTYPEGQFSPVSAGEWKPGDVMEILVRGSIAIPCSQSGQRGSPVYIRKSDGVLTTYAGSEGSTVKLENVHIRQPWDSRCECAEAVVNERNSL